MWLYDSHRLLPPPTCRIVYVLRCTGAILWALLPALCRRTTPGGPAPAATCRAVRYDFTEGDCGASRGMPSTTGITAAAIHNAAFFPHVLHLFHLGAASEVALAG